MAFPFAKTLEHHGLVAGFCREIELAKIIDKALGTSEQRNISFGQLFVAMILNGLGFTGRTLHMYSEYFEDKPLDRLIAPGILPEHINDDALGRCLDELFEFGVSSLYQTIGEAVIHHLKLPCESVHLDSTSFHYDGQSQPSEDDINTITITKGYSRDHRPELNQVILNLICENQSGIPVYMKAASGNSNDMEGFKKIVKSHVRSLKAAQASRYLVADAALYVKETIEHLAAMGQLFITRVPQTLKESKGLVSQAHELVFEEISQGYQGVWHESHYGEVKQKWLLVRSEQAAKREGHTLDKRIKKRQEQAEKSFKKLAKQRFFCEADAQKALQQWSKKQEVVDVDANITAVAVYAKAGRPKATDIPKRIDYQISGTLSASGQYKEQALRQLGLFIIATNDLSDTLSMEKLLSTYKSQQSVEKGFRFLKSPDFLTSAIYLKKPQRIEALLMVMTCCLMVYASLEHQIRAKLKEQNQYFPDMKKKPYQRPTARWVFQCFQGIIIMYMAGQTPFVANLKPRQQTIINCLGSQYQQIYS